MKHYKPLNLSENQDQDAVKAAVLRFLKAKAPAAKPVVSCERIAGNYARVSARDEVPGQQPLHGFARRDAAGKWEVLAMGTHFDQAFFKRHGIPERLQK